MEYLKNQANSRFASSFGSQNNTKNHQGYSSKDIFECGAQNLSKIGQNKQKALENANLTYAAVQTNQGCTQFYQNGNEELKYSQIQPTTWQHFANGEFLQCRLT